MLECEDCLTTGCEECSQSGYLHEAWGPQNLIPARRGNIPMDQEWTGNEIAMHPCEGRDDIFLREKVCEPVKWLDEDCILEKCNLCKPGKPFSGGGIND